MGGAVRRARRERLHLELDRSWLDDDEARVVRDAVAAVADVDLVVPFDAGSWLFVRSGWGWSTRDDAVVARYAAGAGATFGRPTSR
ncbi:MAG: hypothetical protein ACOZNI_21260 [Myxococcota bacterium]